MVTHSRGKNPPPLPMGGNYTTFKNFLLQNKVPHHDDRRTYGRAISIAWTTIMHRALWKAHQLQAAGKPAMAPWQEVEQLRGLFKHVCQHGELLADAITLKQTVNEGQPVPAEFYRWHFLAVNKEFTKRQQPVPVAWVHGKRF